MVRIMADSRPSLHRAAGDGASSRQLAGWPVPWALDMSETHTPTGARPGGGAAAPQPAVERRTPLPNHHADHRPRHLRADRLRRARRAARRRHRPRRRRLHHPVRHPDQGHPGRPHRRDVCGRAKTGSGKTLAFGVPMLARLAGPGEPRRPRPGARAHPRAGAAGGRGARPGRHRLRAHRARRLRRRLAAAADRRAGDRGVDVVVATPLRLIDLLKEDELDLDEVEIVVLDEADRMADDGFTPQVEWILRKVTAPHQTMLFSATLDGDVGHLVRRYMTDPERGGRRRRHRHGRHDAPRVPRRAPHGQGPGRASIAAELRQDARVLPDQAHAATASSATSSTSACRPWRSTATSPRSPASRR